MGSSDSHSFLDPTPTPGLALGAWGVSPSGQPVNEKVREGLTVNRPRAARMCQVPRGDVQRPYLPLLRYLPGHSGLWGKTEAQKG